MNTELDSYNRETRMNKALLCIWLRKKVIAVAVFIIAIYVATI